MTVIWRDEMSVGDGKLDDDHKHLFNLINGFEWATSGEIHFDILEKVLEDLVAYTAMHFTREEKVQAAIRYPYHDAHKASHRALIRQLHEVQKHVKAGSGKKAEEGEIIVKEMAGFLNHWLVDHIIDEDLRMKPFLAKTGPARK